MTPYYSAHGITIYHGDCRLLLPSLTADLLLTDPPYGIKAGRKSGFGAGVKTPRTGFTAGKRLVKNRDYGPESDWDDRPPSPWLFDVMREQTKWQIIFGGNYFPLPSSRCWLVWDKVNGASDYADCELAWTNLDKAVRMIQHRWNGFLQEKGHKEKRFHPTQKPLRVMRWCISQAPPSNVRAYSTRLWEWALRCSRLSSKVVQPSG